MGTPLPPAGMAEDDIANVCAALGIEWRGSMTGREVVQLLNAWGFQCVPGTISEFIRKRYIEPPRDGTAWTAGEIFYLAAAMEMRRRWKPEPSPKDEAKSQLRLLIDRQGEGVIAEAMRHTIEDLLLYMADANDPVKREVFYEAISRKMRANGFIEE